MDKNEHSAVFKDDFLQAAKTAKRASIFLKLIYYFFQRPIADFFIRKKLERHSAPKKILDYMDLFLNNEGGMFKDHAYKLCNRFSPLKNSSVLVPGIGYGKNLLQLAAWRPKKIVAFDLYEYKEKWDFLKKTIEEKFGVETIFLKGDFDVLDENWADSFDFIITDGVWEHVKNLPVFLGDSKKFLKNGGIYYASFGPLWWGPGGDHLDWGEKKIFNHVLLSEKKYQEEFNKRFGRGEISYDFCEGAFLVQKKLFSYLKVDDYLDCLEKAGGFEKKLAYAKISRKAMSLVEQNPGLLSELNGKNIPLFDRFCGGLFLWLKLHK